jgi:hypothetical protein
MNVVTDKNGIVRVFPETLLEHEAMLYAQNHVTDLAGDSTGAIRLTLALAFLAGFARALDVQAVRAYSRQ